MTVGSTRHQSSLSMIALFGALAVALAIVAWTLLGRSLRDGSGSGGTNVAVNAPAQALLEFVQTQPTVAIEEKIVVYDGGLIGANAKTLQEQLQTAMDLPVEVVTVEGMTTRQAIKELTPIVRAPPKHVVIDFGRFDQSAGVPEAETTLNLRTIVQKVIDVGSRTVVIGGISSDGNTRFAEAVRASLPASAQFVDVTSFLLTTILRDSPTKLNAAGTKSLGERVIAAWQQSPTP